VNVLHIDSSPLSASSISRALSARIVEGIRACRPDATVIRRDLGLDPPAHASAEILDIIRFKRLENLNPRQQREKALSDVLVAEVLATDILVIGAPMYNFTVPTQLKAWIDRVCQAGLTFRYTAEGPVGLATGKRVIVAAARGGFYTRERDFQLPTSAKSSGSSASPISMWSWRRASTSLRNAAPRRSIKPIVTPTTPPRESRC
jgi:FMN-dependent NADH-azoreductase